MSLLEIIKIDKMGFPMIKVESIKAYIHFYPVTKIQFEYFLTSMTAADFDETWYNEILQMNPRVSPSQLNEDNYWQAFITGVLPKEAKRFAEWCGQNFAIPTLKQWCDAYNELKEKLYIPIDDLIKVTNPPTRIKTLMTHLDDAPKHKMNRLGIKPTLDYQMLLRRGVLEWVDDSDAPRNHWGGMGQVNRDFYQLPTDPDACEPTQPRNAETARAFYYGFRLIMRQ